MRIAETFVSIQGEGLLVGTPSSFVRTTGCNLRCAYCDTPETSWSPVGVRRTVDDLVAFCAEGPRHVVVTGGEPLLQPAVGPFVARLRRAGHHVTIETAATVAPVDVSADLWSLSPKLAFATPDGRHAARHDALRHRPEIVRALMARGPWQLKFVVRAAEPATLAADVAEVEASIAAYGVRDADRPRVLLMAEGTDPDGLERAERLLAPVCIEHGFTLGQRLHIRLFGHRPGT
ncbi:MAG: 7-carboxy-7-deazaguanine synthase QueE [Deltaproteobacteria bacterium]|nr:MAG: 7-carboxy-7-deazaguanine synthase QueE [Deltaproteobacteria bacterium]